MAVFNLNGQELETVYNTSGNELQQAYDVNGNPLIEASDLTIMTYNVQNFSGRNSNEAMQKRIMAAYKPDIIGLQEVTNTSDQMPALGVELFADYAHQFIGGGLSRQGVVSKIAIPDVAFTFYKNNSGAALGFTKAYINVAGKQVAYFNTHIVPDPSIAAHVQQTAEIFEKLQAEPYFIITGDFNAELHSTEDAEYADCIKQFIDAGYNMANWKDAFTDTWFNSTTVAGSSWKCPCDNIITSPNITIQSVVFDPIKLEYPSNPIDHIAVVAGLKIN